MSETLLAIYDDLRAARQVVSDLVEAGFPRETIGLAIRDAEGEYARYVDGDVSENEGAEFGAVVGLLTGAAAGLFAITIPGIGPIIAAGPLSALLGAAAGGGIGAATGAVAGSIVAALIDMGIPEEDAQRYVESLRQGNALVSIAVNDESAVIAADIMEHYNPVDIDRRSIRWQEGGWQ